jgi:hypothetical protein
VKNSFSAIGVVALAVLGGNVDAIASDFTNWAVSANFTEKGTAICSVKFRVPKHSPSLTLEGVAPKGSRELEPFMHLGGLPPLLGSDKHTIRDVGMRIGSSWSARGLKADWKKGSSDDSSKISFYAATSLMPVLQPLASGGKLVIDVPLSNGTHSYSFDLAGAVGPMRAFINCLNRGSIY